MYRYLIPGALGFQSPCESTCKDFGAKLEKAELVAPCFRKVFFIFSTVSIGFCYRTRFFNSSSI